MIYSLGRACTVAALCVALGLHWFLLQSVAWTSMVVKYSQEAPLAVAIAKTFDGNHPCSICHAVRDGKQTEKKSELLPPAYKFDLIAAKSPPQLVLPFQNFPYQWLTESPNERTQSPLFIPPRSALS